MTGLPKFTKQKLVCSKLEKKAGLMICANEDLSAKRGPFYIFQVVVDKDAGTDPEAMERIPHRITVCPPFQLENLLPVSIQVRTRTRTRLAPLSCPHWWLLFAVRGVDSPRPESAAYRERDHRQG